MENKRVIILYNEITKNASSDELDILDQVKVVSDALVELGYEVTELTLSLNMKKAVAEIKKIKPYFVFNLVESLQNSGELLYFASALLTYLGIPFTGVHHESMFITSNKFLAKKQFKQYGIPTAEFFSLTELDKLNPLERYIIKPIWEDGSLGIDEHSVFYGNDLELIAKLKKYNKNKFFVEQYIDGREFNISVLGGDAEPKVMPLAEIKFKNFPEGKPKIMGYTAKWIEDTFEYENTERTFEFTVSDKSLREKISEITKKCWNAFDMRGYVRVDFRVDKNDNPFVLEINSNPCISPSSGFYVATSMAGMKFTDVVKLIIKDAFI